MPTSPSTLLAWRELELGEPSRTAWKQFEPFFEEHGYKLFVTDPTFPIHLLVPPAGCSAVRCEDEYRRFLPDCLRMKPKPSRFLPESGIHVAARSPKNTDVVIRIMAIGDDIGENRILFD